MSVLTLTLRQPAQAGDKARSDYVLSTYRYLPGTVVRGAFAAAWIAAHGEPVLSSPNRREFLRLFEGGVRFGPLFAGQEFTPLSVVSHKYPATGQCAVIEHDRAVDDDVPDICPDCGSPLLYLGGLRGHATQVQRRTSVAIATSGVARRRQLVTRDTLAAGQSFSGSLVVSEPDAQQAREALAQLSPVRVGGRRTTHGTADVSLGDGEPPTAQRRADGRLIIRLRSAGIFINDHGRPSREPRAGELASLLGSPARIIRRWTRWETVGGWHIASGLPKPAELAVAAGSAYLVETRGDVTADVLAKLGRRGLGLRRQEGFGDLAPPPVLMAGRAAREAERRKLQLLMDSVAPLRGLAVTRPDIWPQLVERLTAHAGGDPSATQFLRGMTGQLEPHTRRGLAAFLAMSPADAAEIARELGTL